MNEYEAERMLYDMYFNKLNLCGCGVPEYVLTMIKEVLNALNRQSVKERREVLFKTLGFEATSLDELTTVQYGMYKFILDVLDEAEIIEHGSSIHGAWLTEYGKQILEAFTLVENLEDVMCFVE